ncbi:MAG: DinB family protein [Ignavibacteriales bacterium]|nr:MAG: DinB family protein [Ignavibacteriales bacterium]
MNNQLEKKFHRLEELRSDIISLFTNSPKGLMNVKPFENKWSPLQILYHIIRAEQATIIALKRSIKDYQLKEEMGFFSPLRTIQLKFLFGLPKKIKAPKGIDNIPDSSDYDELIKKWESLRKDMKEFFQSIPPDAITKNLFSTWYSNKMNIHHITEFLILHSERHYRQIKKLIRSS